MHPPANGDSWLAITDSALPIGEIYEWCLRSDCGAVVVFSGIARDHAVDSEGNRRVGVTHLAYEVYENQVLPSFAAIEAEVRQRWPETGRVAVLHRIGDVSLSESSVVVAVSAPHRPGAFEAARFAIDAVKASAPIWKHETWADGADWGTGSHQVVAPSEVATAPRDLLIGDRP
ncbi:MAG: molybdenum cofactor biosynthesis protein MoaE [Actinobacteria bacterium]|nr:molybdenum cofactor biosynthesis protein MoaE [Actinomycetota bacterium]